MPTRPPPIPSPAPDTIPAPLWALTAATVRDLATSVLHGAYSTPTGAFIPPVRIPPCEWPLPSALPLPDFTVVLVVPPVVDVPLPAFPTAAAADAAEDLDIFWC